MASRPNSPVPFFLRGRGTGNRLMVSTGPRWYRLSMLNQKWRSHNAMRKMACLALGLLSLSGCISFDRGKSGDPYQQAIKKELAELVKAYRVCLQKYEDNPTKA